MVANIYERFSNKQIHERLSLPHFTEVFTAPLPMAEELLLRLECVLAMEHCTRVRTQRMLSGAPTGLRSPFSDSHTYQAFSINGWEEDQARLARTLVERGEFNG